MPLYLMWDHVLIFSYSDYIFVLIKFFNLFSLISFLFVNMFVFLYDCLYLTSFNHLEWLRLFILSKTFICPGSEWNAVNVIMTLNFIVHSVKYAHETLIRRFLKWVRMQLTLPNAYTLFDRWKGFIEVPHLLFWGWPLKVPLPLECIPKWNSFCR